MCQESPAYFASSHSREYGAAAQRATSGIHAVDEARTARKDPRLRAPRAVPGVGALLLLMSVQHRLH